MWFQSNPNEGGHMDTRLSVMAIKISMLFSAMISVLIFLLVFSGERAQAATAAPDEGVKIEGLKIDGKPAGSEVKVLVYKQLLCGGKVYIAGKVVSGQGGITAVDVSNDNKKTWNKAALMDNGSFEYGFRPAAPAVYTVCIRITDSKGVQAVIEASCREIEVSEKAPYVLVRETLDRIVQAYEEKNIPLIMSYVSEDFFGDKTIFESSLRTAEHLYTDIDIRYTVDNVVPDYNDKIFVTVTFNRRYTAIKTGKTTADSGSTSFIFKFEDCQLKLLSMSKPLIFL